MLSPSSNSVFSIKNKTKNANASNPQAKDITDEIYTIVLISEHLTTLSLKFP